MSNENDGLPTPDSSNVDAASMANGLAAAKTGKQSLSKQASTKSHPGKKRKYIPAVTPRLKIFLYLVFGLFAMLMANSIYLASITSLEAITQKLYQDYFYIWMFFLHLVLGLVLIVPFIVFIAFHLRATFRRKNRSAVRVGYFLLFIVIALLFSGLD